MNKPDVYVTCMIPQPAIELLKEHCSVEVNPNDTTLTRAQLMEKVKGRDAVLCLLTDKIDDQIFEAAGSQCKIFANYAVGYNNIDIDAATQRGIIITNTPGVLDNATAETAWTLLFAASRRVVEADQYTRTGQFKGWGSMLFLGQGITGKTLGIIGAGRIGCNFAVKGSGFNMQVLYTDVKPNPDFEKATGAKYVDQNTLLKQADFISIHVPLLPATRHLISTAQFAMMKKTAVLINTSRGPVVDEKALVKALQEKEIFAAGLDVFENEPQLEPGLAELDNVVILPHVGSATIETRTEMGLIAACNIINVLNGEKPGTCVNPGVLK